MTDQVLDLLAGEDYEDMDMRRRPTTSADSSTTATPSYADEDKRKQLARSAKYGHQHRAHDDDPDEWQGAPPTFGGAPETPEQTAARLAKGQGYKAQFGVPRSTFQPPAGHQNNRVKARNAAQLTYPWHLPMLAHTSVPDTSVPDSFDWRVKAGADLLTPVLDQGECGCCWAFASGQSLADRMRIASIGGNTVVPVLSAEYIKDCGTAALGARYDQLLDLGTQGTTGTCAAGASLSMGCEFLANYGAVSSQALPFSSSTAQGQDIGKCFAPRANDILYTAKPGKPCAAKSHAKFICGRSLARLRRRSLATRKRCRPDRGTQRPRASLASRHDVGTAVCRRHCAKRLEHAEEHYALRAALRDLYVHEGPLHG